MIKKPHTTKSPQEYQEEMMRLYRQAHPTASAVPASAPKSEPIPEPEPIVPTPPTPPEPEPIPESVSMPDTSTESLPMPESLPPDSAHGFLKITTRTAGSALPIPDTAVKIFRNTPQGRELCYTAITDESGETEPIRLPAPLPDGDNRIQPYAVYEIEVFRSGYARMTSSYVPIYANITSLQSFQMLPLPSQVTDAQHPILYTNPEPDF